MALTIGMAEKATPRPISVYAICGRRLAISSRSKDNRGEDGAFVGLSVVIAAHPSRRRGDPGGETPPLQDPEGARSPRPSVPAGETPPLQDPEGAGFPRPATH